MLRILRIDVKGRQVVLMLQGLIVAEWAGLLEAECQELIGSGLRVALDLTEVTFIGRSGLGVLRRLGRAGVEIRSCPPLIADMLEQEGIKAGRIIEETNDAPVPWKRGGDTDA